MSNQLEANGWYIWWEKKWILRIPHYVLLFNVRPEKYELIMITKKNARYIKCDPFHLNSKGVLIQKRDVFLYSSIFNPMKYARFIIIDKT